MNAHYFAYREHIGQLWMLGKISQSEYMKLTHKTGNLRPIRQGGF